MWFCVPIARQQLRKQYLTMLHRDYSFRPTLVHMQVPRPVVVSAISMWYFQPMKLQFSPSLLWWARCQPQTMLVQIPSNGRNNISIAHFWAQSRMNFTKHTPRTSTMASANWYSASTRNIKFSVCLPTNLISPIRARHSIAMDMEPKNISVVHSMRCTTSSKLHLEIEIENWNSASRTRWYRIKIVYSPMTRSRTTPVNAHHPNDKRWMLGIDSMKNSERINVITTAALISNDLFLIGY